MNTATATTATTTTALTPTAALPDPAQRASYRQYVRKLSGFNLPAQGNAAAFERAVADVAGAARRLIESLVTNAEPRDRATEAAKARARSALRFGAAPQTTTAQRESQRESL